MTAVTPTDRPKSVRNSCVIKVFGGVFMLSRCFLDCSVGVGVFVTGLSQISSLFSHMLGTKLVLRLGAWPLHRFCTQTPLSFVEPWSYFKLAANELKRTHIYCLIRDNSSRSNLNIEFSVISTLQFHTFFYLDWWYFLHVVGDFWWAHFDFCKHMKGYG